MRKGSVALVAALCIVGGLTACDEATNPVDDKGTTALFAPGGNQDPSCDFRGLKGDARDYFSNPESRDAQDLIKLMEDACGSDQAAVTASGWLLLSLVEQVVYQGSGGDAAAGDGVVNGALAFMFPCEAGDAGCTVPSGDFTAALGPDAGSNGAFGVRGLEADSTPVFSRGSPTWAAEPGVDPSTGEPYTWQESLPAEVPVALLYGAPQSSSGFPINDTPLGGTYQWNILPPLPADGFDQQLVIGVCDVDAPGESEVGRVQRNATILQPGLTSACDIDSWDDQYPFAAAPSSNLERLAEGALRLVESIAPAPLLASLAGRGGGGTAGQADNFSDFTPVGANTDAELIFVTQPTDITIGGGGEATFGTIEVLARTTTGTPIEFIEITLSSVDNNGATVVLGGSTTETTVENGGIATFDGLTLNKTGGYRLCATAVAVAFDFVDGPYCSDRINVRPN